MLIHGPTGHPTESWRADNNILWPKLLSKTIPPQLATARVLSYGYDTYNCSIFDIGQSFLSQLLVKRDLTKVINYSLPSRIRVR